MTEKPELPLCAADGVISRRAALGGLVSAVLLPSFMSNAVAAEPSAPAPSPTAAVLPVAREEAVVAVSPQARTLHTATLMPDGRILVVGGMGHGRTALSGAQAYDPVQDIWTSAASMQTARYQHAAVVLPDGRVLVTGGISHGSRPVSGGEVYDFSTNTWSPAAAMRLPRYGHTLTSLGDGRVMVIGGCFTNPLSGAEVYLPDSQS